MPCTAPVLPWRRYILQTYARPEIVFVHGEGAKMYDVYGKEYLDFSAGIAVNALGVWLVGRLAPHAARCCCEFLNSRSFN